MMQLGVCLVVLPKNFERKILPRGLDLKQPTESIHQSQQEIKARYIQSDSQVLPLAVASISNS